MHINSNVKSTFKITNRLSMFCIALIASLLYSSALFADGSDAISPAKTDDSSSGSLRIHVDQIQPSKGHIIALLSNDDEGYPNDRNLAFRVSQVEVKGAVVELAMDNIPPGNYVVSLFHDSNNDGELNRYWYGAPKEGVGVSNNVKGSFGPPDYEKCVINVTGNPLDLRISLHYL